MDIDIGDGSGEISSEDEAEAVEKSEYQLRKEYQKTRDFTVVKCGLLKLCDNHSMRDLFEVCRCRILKSIHFLSLFMMVCSKLTTKLFLAVCEIVLSI